MWRYIFWEELSEGLIDSFYSTVLQFDVGPCPPEILIPNLLDRTTMSSKFGAHETYGTESSHLLRRFPFGILPLNRRQRILHLFIGFTWCTKWSFWILIWTWLILLNVFLFTWDLPWGSCVEGNKSQCNASAACDLYKSTLFLINYIGETQVMQWIIAFLAFALKSPTTLFQGTDNRTESESSLYSVIKPWKWNFDSKGINSSIGWSETCDIEGEIFGDNKSNASFTSSRLLPSLKTVCLPESIT